MNFLNFLVSCWKHLKCHTHTEIFIFIFYSTIDSGVKGELVFLKLIGTDKHVNSNKTQHLDIHFETITRSLIIKVTISCY